MKMVKSLLLGTAAGLVAVAGAQAADMPVKAKPVLYVKICTLYGDGFYYIPGTDTCIKMGGYARIQAEYNAGGGGVNDGTLSQLIQARYNRQETNDIDYRVRGAISWDVRQQTEYGTLRTYIRTGVNQSTPADGIAGVVFWDRAFIQFAGFTVGKAQSFFDTVTYGGAFTYHNVRTVSDTGASGWNVWAYTAQFGNGFSGTLSLEDPNRNRSVWDNTLTGFIAYGAGNFDNAFGAQTAAKQRHADAGRDRQSAARPGLGLCQRQRRVARRCRRVLRQHQLSGASLRRTTASATGIPPTRRAGR